jgi:hypothetical protein
MVSLHRPHSNIHRTVSNFMAQGKELLHRLRSPEGNMLREVELHNLRVYLDLLNIEATDKHHRIIARPKQYSSGGNGKVDSKVLVHEDRRDRTKGSTRNGR